MPKNILLIVLAALCLKFSAKAQTKAIDITGKGIQIGQQVPDFTITNLYNYKDANGKSTTTAKISDFRGKLLILDFWATWCGPCVAMIPKMDSLQKQFKGEMRFLSVTYQTKQEVLPFLEKYEKQKHQHSEIAGALSDQKLNQLFPHLYLPHYVWIDRDGTVKAITEYKDIQAANIAQVLNHQSFVNLQKRDLKINYDANQSLLSQSFTDSSLLIKSGITRYIKGLEAGFSQNLKKKDGPEYRFIRAKNYDLPRMYSFAYGQGTDVIGWNRIFIETQKPELLKSFVNGSYSQQMLDSSVLCYELIIHKNLTDRAWLIMQTDLAESFPQYRASLEERNIPCYILIKTSDIDKIKTQNATSGITKDPTGGYHMKNWPLKRLITELNVLYLQNSPYPIVDGTNYQNWVDMDLESLNDVDKLNLSLAKYDLKLVKANRPIKVLVIRDRS